MPSPVPSRASSSASSASFDSTIQEDQVESRLLAKIILVVSLILLVAPCGLILLPGGFPYAVTCLTLGPIFFIFSSYLLCKK